MHWRDRSRTGAAIAGLTKAGAGVLSPADPVAPAVVFNRVSFAFDEHVVLRDVSFTVPRGSMKILLGASGAGKSVVLRTKASFMVLHNGQISFEGSGAELRASQEAYLREFLFMTTPPW